MKKTVTKGFRMFHGMLTPTCWESQTAKNQRISIETCLKKSFGVTRFFRTGSFGNGTSIRNYSDVDYFACIPIENLEENSFTTLQVIQNALLKVLRYTKIDIRPNPTRGIEIKAQQTLAPRVLSPDQRFVLRNLVEKADDLRGKALFALGYWAGCRVSDVSHLLVEHAPVGPKIGWLHVGFKGEKFRDIDLLNEARRPLACP